MTALLTVLWICLVLVFLTNGIVADTCANDCANVTSRVVCFHSNHCGSGVPGDFDYYAFAQIYLPQYCSALTRGVDITARYNFRRCVKGRTVPTKLSIHGLWPNYVDGYPQCCSQQMPFANGSTTTSFNPPIDAPALFKRMLVHWSDPASDDAVCGQMWNHEYLKHGSCLALPGIAPWFVNLTLSMHDLLATQTNQVEQLRIRHQGQLFNATEIRQLYPNQIQLVCDPSTMQHNQLIELRTCWTVSPTTGNPDTPMDCEPDRHECPAQIAILP